MSEGKWTAQRREKRRKEREMRKDWETFFEEDEELKKEEGHRSNSK